MNGFDRRLQQLFSNDKTDFTHLLDEAIEKEYEIFKPEGLEDVLRKAFDYEPRKHFDPKQIDDENHGPTTILRYGFSPISLKKIESTKRKEVNIPVFPNTPFENTNLEYNLFPKNQENITDREYLEVETHVIQSVAEKSYRIDVFWHEPQGSQNIDMRTTPERGFRFRKEDDTWKPVNEFYQTPGDRKTTLEVMQNKDNSNIFDKHTPYGLKEVTAQGLSRILRKEAEVRRLKHSRVSAVNKHGRYTNIKSPLRN